MRVLHARHGDGGRSACSPKNPIPPRPTSPPSWIATSAAAAPTRASSARSRWRRAEDASARVAELADRAVRSSNSEPERYELSEPPRYTFEPPDVNRREFLRLFGAVGGGLIVIASMPAATRSRRADAARRGREAPVDLGGVDSHRRARTRDGVHRQSRDRTEHPDVALAGRGRRAARADRADHVRHGRHRPHALRSGDVRIEDDAGDGAAAGAGGGDGAGDPHRSGGGAVADRSRVAACGRGGQSLPPTAGSIAYGELDRRQAPRRTRDRRGGAARAWTLRGKPVRKVQGRDFVTGRARLHAGPRSAEHARSAASSGRRPTARRLRSVDDRAARAMAGVTVVRDGDFIGVVAPTDRAVRRAATAIQVEWSAPPRQPDVGDGLRASEEDRRGRGGRRRTRRRRAAAGRRRRARARPRARRSRPVYHIPYIAHVPLEPRAAVAEWTDGKVTVWTGTQRPFGVRREVATAFGARRRIACASSCPTWDPATAASTPASRRSKRRGSRARPSGRSSSSTLATRSSRWGYFRPAGVIDIKAGVDATGRLTFWEFDNYNSGNAGLPTPYVVANKREAFHASDSPLRQGSYRGLAATANHYAREMHMDAIARAARRRSARVPSETSRQRAHARRARRPPPNDPAGRAPRDPIARSASRAGPKRAVTSPPPSRWPGPPADSRSRASSSSSNAARSSIPTG